MVNGIKYPDSKVHGANMGPTCVLSAPGGPHVGPINLDIRVLKSVTQKYIDELESSLLLFHPDAFLKIDQYDSTNQS